MRTDRAISNYFERYAFHKKSIFNRPITESLGLVVVIPCFDEPDILTTLNSLITCELPYVDVEVIILINDGQHVPAQVKERHIRTTKQLEEFTMQNSHARLNFLVSYQHNLPAKKAGVGLARKIGMDEALRRLFSAGNAEAGLIVCLDADCTVEPNYLVEIKAYFDKFPKAPAATIYYEHLLDEISDELKEGIIKYELLLRYYSNALKLAGYPHYMQTVGSTMVVRASAYAKAGGMNTRQAAEDFHFLHKLTVYGQILCINSTKISIKTRVSHRVPFGTGKAMNNWLSGSQQLTTIYHPGIFLILKKFLKILPKYYANENSLTSQEASLFNRMLMHTGLTNSVPEIKHNCSTYEQFTKHFFLKFNGLAILKFIKQFTEKVPLEVGVSWLLSKLITFEPTSINLDQQLMLLRKVDLDNN